MPKIVCRRRELLRLGRAHPRTTPEPDQGSYFPEILRPGGQRGATAEGHARSGYPRREPCQGAHPTGGRDHRRANARERPRGTATVRARASWAGTPGNGSSSDGGWPAAARSCIASEWRGSPALPRSSCVTLAPASPGRVAHGRFVSPCSRTRPKHRDPVRSNLTAMKLGCSMVLLAGAIGCSTQRGCPLPTPSADGLPSQQGEVGEALIGAEKDRRCQIIFEASWWADSAMWMTPDRDGSAMVTVRAWTSASELTTHRARLGAQSAARAERACREFMSQPRGTCDHDLLDGESFIVTHPTADGVYLTRTFSSPRIGSVEGDFVAFARALRDRAALPEPLNAETEVRMFGYANRVICAFKREPFC